MPKTVQVELEYHDRKTGPGTVAGKARVEAGGLTAGIGRGIREVWKAMDRKQRFDATKNGIIIKAQIVGDAAEETAATTAPTA